MELMMERRDDRQPRVPLHIPVELRPDDFEDGFEADAIDMSCGGLSMRASCLPEEGSQLVCRFRLLPGNPPLELKGEVAWAQLEGRRSGEFGVRFVDVPDDQTALIAELLAERSALTRQAHQASAAAQVASLAPTATPGTPAPVVTPDPPAPDPLAPPPEFGVSRPQGSVVYPDAAADRDLAADTGGDHHGSAREVELALDTGAELAGRLAKCTRSQAIFVQPLELLTVGQGLWLRRPNGQDRRASICGVHLRLEGPTPVLAVSVAFDGVEASFSDLEWDPSDAVEGASISDTVPDVEPPAEVAAVAGERTTVSEFGPGAPADREVRARPEPRRSVAPPARPLEPSMVVHQTDAVEPEAAAEKSSAPERDDQAGVHDLEWDQGGGTDHEMVPGRAASARAEQPGSPPLIAAIGALARLTERAQERLAGHGSSLRKHTGTVGSMGREKARILGRTVSTLAVRRRRRTTAAPRPRRQAAREATRRGPGLMFLMSLLAMGAIALAVYALAPRGSGPEVVLHRPIAAEPSVAEAGDTTTVEAVDQGQATVKPTQRPPRVPAPATVPAGSAYAATAGERGQTDPPTTTKSKKSAATFGASRVANPRMFTLRMTQPVKQLQGTPDVGGFTVVIPGALSLDRAGPIAAKHRAIKRSMILNKGDHSELTMRFEPGRKPAYRVQAKGTSLQILLAQR